MRGRAWKQVSARCPAGRRAQVPLIVIALDDQAGGRVDHVEIADRQAVLIEHVFPVPAGIAGSLHIELEDAQILLAVDHFQTGAGGIDQRALQQGIEEATIG